MHSDVSADNVKKNIYILDNVLIVKEWAENMNYCR